MTVFESSWIPLSTMVAPDMLLSQKKRKTWQYSGGESVRRETSVITVCKDTSQLAKPKNPIDDQYAYMPSSHVMNELLETERAYVEELLCVLEVSGHCDSHSISTQGLDSSLLE